TMDGCNHGSVERPLMAHPDPAFIRGGRAKQLIKLPAQSLAHFVGGAIGEGDGNDLVYRNVASAKDVEVAFDQYGGLARARSGGDRDMPIDSVSSFCLCRL